MPPDPVVADKFTTHIDQPMVVFVLGARANHLRKLRQTLQVFSAFTPMLDTLRAHPEKGFLHGDVYFTLIPLATVMISYWRSYDDLERFSRSKDDPHLAAWHDFNRKVGYDGSVGIWHETYLVAPGQVEALYGNMPPIGLAKATGHIESVTRGAAHLRKGRGRLTGTEPTLSPELEVYDE
ncbi:MAG: DUF4188 domain-containing protein [bacterium]|nr:DUF4188 domain-containing protein [bacterium]